MAPTSVAHPCHVTLTNTQKTLGFQCTLDNYQSTPLGGTQKNDFLGSLTNAGKDNLCQLRLIRLGAVRTWLENLQKLKDLIGKPIQPRTRFCSQPVKIYFIHIKYVVSNLTNAVDIKDFPFHSSIIYFLVFRRPKLACISNPTSSVQHTKILLRCMLEY